MNVEQRNKWYEVMTLTSGDFIRSLREVFAEDHRQHYGVSGHEKRSCPQISPQQVSTMSARCDDISIWVREINTKSWRQKSALWSVENNTKESRKAFVGIEAIFRLHVVCQRKHWTGFSAAADFDSSSQNPHWWQWSGDYSNWWMFSIFLFRERNEFTWKRWKLKETQWCILFDGRVMWFMVDVTEVENISDQFSSLVTIVWYNHLSACAQLYIIEGLLLRKMNFESDTMKCVQLPVSTKYHEEPYHRICHNHICILVKAYFLVTQKIFLQ